MVLESGRGMVKKYPGTTQNTVLAKGQQALQHCHGPVSEVSFIHVRNSQFHRGFRHPSGHLGGTEAAGCQRTRQWERPEGTCVPRAQCGDVTSVLTCGGGYGGFR